MLRRSVCEASDEQETLFKRVAFESYEDHEAPCGETRGGHDGLPGIPLSIPESTSERRTALVECCAQVKNVYNEWA